MFSNRSWILWSRGQKSPNLNQLDLSSSVITEFKSSKPKLATPPPDWPIWTICWFFSFPSKVNLYVDKDLLPVFPSPNLSVTLHLVHFSFQTGLGEFNLTEFHWRNIPPLWTWPLLNPAGWQKGWHFVFLQDVYKCKSWFQARAHAANRGEPSFSSSIVDVFIFVIVIIASLSLLPSSFSS